MCKLSTEDRFIACIHEAAHAVILRLGGCDIYKVEVAPEGASEWATTGKNGNIIKDLLGGCFSSCPLDTPYIQWNDEKRMYNCDKKAFSEAMQRIGKMEATELRRQIRAFIIGTLAGYVAELVFDDDAKNCPSLSLSNDIVIAEAMHTFLPYPSEKEYLVNETERVLREPEIWKHVLNLAHFLEQSGKIESCELLRYLPEPRKKWPKRPPKEYKTLIASSFESANTDL